MLHTGEGLGRTGEALLVNRNVRILTSLKHPLSDGTTGKPLEYEIRAEPAMLAAGGKEEDVMFRSISAPTLLVLLVGALLLTPASADTITVCWDGSGDYLTIQEGINAAVDGDTVLVLDGTYTGPGNRDLDFGGKAITVRSENGPDNCIIDCEGRQADPHRGFFFYSGETTAAVVDGFTIQNGYARSEGECGTIGGGILCMFSNPTIANCTIIGNTAADE